MTGVSICDPDGRPHPICAGHIPAVGLAGRAGFGKVMADLIAEGQSEPAVLRGVSAPKTSQSAANTVR